MEAAVVERIAKWIRTPHIPGHDTEGEVHVLPRLTLYA